MSRSYRVSSYTCASNDSMNRCGGTIALCERLSWDVSGSGCVGISYGVEPWGIYLRYSVLYGTPVSRCWLTWWGGGVADMHCGRVDNAPRDSPDSEGSPSEGCVCVLMPCCRACSVLPWTPSPTTTSKVTKMKKPQSKTCHGRLTPLTS